MYIGCEEGVAIAEIASNGGIPVNQAPFNLTSAPVVEQEHAAWKALNAIAANTAV